MIHRTFEMITMKKNLRAHRRELDQLRLELLKDQLTNANENVSYYREAFERNGLNPSGFKEIGDLMSYPIIEREDIQRDNSRFISDAFSKKNLKKSHSSGSTGRPLWTCFDRHTWTRKKYFSKLRTRWECGLKLGEKVAIFDTDPLEELPARNNKIICSNPALRVKCFSVFDNVLKNVNGLIRWKPQNVDAPPSHLFQLAILMEKKAIKFDWIKRIFTSSEYLEHNMKQFIEGIFDAKIFDIYGCTEIKEISWECERHEGYHINEDEVYVEILNGSEPAKPGMVGDIVLTDLLNKAMPIIRYRIGDRGMLLDGNCNCGRTFSLMVPSAGRSSDYIVTPSGNKISPYRFTTAIEKISGILQYQFIQDTINSITIKVVMDTPEKENALQKIEPIICSIIGEPIQIQVVVGDSIEIEENGKFRAVKSNLNYFNISVRRRESLIR